MLDPSEVDWTQEPDSEVWWAAQSGIQQAVEEAKNRGLLEPAQPLSGDSVG
ncbi:hypothetical protein GCM10009858_44540 [Terrabacter carboxydivorans]|uniref:Uncharacterized protein n=1 Tax=Terrabacter carboxydivorans TaxID=619730 RepID=A0ABN3MFV9_9MICO